MWIISLMKSLLNFVFETIQNEDMKLILDVTLPYLMSLEIQSPELQENCRTYFETEITNR